MRSRRPVPKIDPGRCAPSARRRGDPLLATAAPVTGWLLIEAPGPWGRQALSESRFSADVAAGLLTSTGARGIRVQVIRRPPDRSGPDRARRWAYVDSRPDREPASWWGEYGEDSELLDVALDGSDGLVSREPILLVCTHARHDACCALLGRPVFSALADAFPENTWETSHVGGDRFAANLVILAPGLYYGGLDADSALRVVTAHASGHIEAAYFRGRSTQPAPAQAADHYLRAHLAESRIDAVQILGVAQRGRSHWAVRLAHGSGAQFEIEVTSTHSAAVPRLTCAATHSAAARRFDLTAIREVERR